MARPIPCEAPVTSATFPFNVLHVLFAPKYPANNNVLSRKNSKRKRCFLRILTGKKIQNGTVTAGRRFHGVCSRKNWLVLIGTNVTRF